MPVGFRSWHSALTALLETSNNWCVNIDKGLRNGVIFVDFKKAFDTIDHEMILQKPPKYGVDHDAMKWFKSYLANRLQRCNVNNYLSSTSPLYCGIPHFTASDMLGLETQINTELKSINLWLKANRLSLNAAKTEFGH